MDSPLQVLFSNHNRISRSEYQLTLLEIQNEMLKDEQVELPLTHDFTPGIYMRTIFMPAGAWVIGKTHKTEHFNIIHTGRAKVMMEGDIKEISAPDMFVSGQEVKKVLYIEEDMTWSTVHRIEDDWLIMDGDKIDVEATVEKLEPMMICSKEEELKLIQTEIERLA